MATPPSSPEGSATSTAAPEDWRTTAEIHDLWRILFAKKSDCVLRVTAPGETVFLRFAGGNLVEATSSHAPSGQRLGEILVALGILTRAELERVLHDSGESRGRIGDRLLDEGLVTREQLQAALRHQAETILARLEDAPTLHVMIGA